MQSPLWLGHEQPWVSGTLGATLALGGKTPVKIHNRSALSAPDVAVAITEAIANRGMPTRQDSIFLEDL